LNSRLISSLSSFSFSLVLRVIPLCSSDISPKGRKQAHSEFLSLRLISRLSSFHFYF
jgi:hypothetical protein